MQIDRVEGVNFRCFEMVDWTLPKLGTTLIDGTNLDTGRSNMTGKTTLIDMVFWALYGWLPRWETPKGGQVDNVIMRGKDRCMVRIHLRNGPKAIVIERQRPAKLKITVDGKPEDLKKGDAEQKIVELIGMTAGQFMLSVVFPQDRKNSFFTMSDTERTALLSVVARVEALDRGLNAAKAQRDQANSQLDRLAGSLKVIEEQLNAIPSKRSDLEAKVREAQADVERVAEHSVLVRRLASEQREAATKLHDESIAGIQASHAREAEALQAQYRAVEAEIQKLGSELVVVPKVEPEFTMVIGELRQQIDRAEAANRESERIERENEKTQEAAIRELNLAEGASQGKCSHCKQDLPVWDKEQAAAKHIAHAQELQQKIRDVPARVDLGPLRAQLEEAQALYNQRKAEVDARPNAVRSEIKTREERKSKISFQLDNLNSGYRASCRDAANKRDSELRAADIKERDAKTEEIRVETALRVASDRLADLVGEEKKLQDKRAEIEQGIAAANAEKDLALDLIDLFGPKGFRAICFDGLIQRISERANYLLGIMTDGLYSTRLDQVGEDSKGAQKLILRPAVIKGGNEVPLDDLSGAARKTYMLAYDIAVSEAIAEGAPLFMDESLDGMDEIGKSEALALLEEVGKSRPILVTEHTAQFKSAFTSVIRVVHSKGVSTLES